MAQDEATKVQRRLSDVINWALAVHGTHSWVISRKCMCAAMEANVMLEYHTLEELIRQREIECNIQDVIDALSIFFGSQNYLEESFGLEGISDIDEVSPSCVVERLCEDVRNPFREALRRIAGSEPEQEEMTLASTLCESEEIQISLLGEDSYHLPWENPPAPHRESLEEIVADYREFQGMIERAYDLLIPTNQRQEHQLRDFRVGSGFVDTIESTDTHRDKTRLKTLVRRCTLFLSGVEHYNAHKLRGEEAPDGSDLSEFYVNLGPVGWRVLYYETGEELVLLKFVKHENATH